MSDEHVRTATAELRVREGAYSSPSWACDALVEAEEEVAGWLRICAARARLWRACALGAQIARCARFAAALAVGILVLTMRAPTAECGAFLCSVCAGKAPEPAREIKRGSLEAPG